MFAMRHERIGRIESDKFYSAGRKYQKKQRRLEKTWRHERRAQAADLDVQLDGNNDIELLRGKIKREELKEWLFEYLDE